MTIKASQLRSFPPCRAAGKARVVQALTPAPDGDLRRSQNWPPASRSGASRRARQGREGVAHLRVWATTADPAGHLAVVTETGRGALVTGSAGQIRAGLARWYGSSLVLLEDLGRGTVRGTVG